MRHLQEPRIVAFELFNVIRRKRLGSALINLSYDKIARRTRDARD